MMTFAQLRDLDTSKLTTAASSAGDLSRSLSSRGQQVTAAAQVPGEMWQGTDANAMSTMLSPHSQPLWDASDAFVKGQATLDDLTEGLNGAKEMLRDAVALTAGTPITISDDGTVTTPPETSPEQDERNQRIAGQVRRGLNEALNAADQADQNAVTALTTIVDSAEFWGNTETTPHSGGLMVEAQGGFGWQDEYDFGDSGTLDWQFGPQGTAGANLPTQPADRLGAWASAMFGLNSTYQAPSTNVAHGVDVQNDANLRVGPSISGGFNDSPRILNYNLEGSNLNLEANLSHTIDRIPGIPITVGINPEVNIDLEEVQENFTLDMPSLDAIKPW